MPAHVSCEVPLNAKRTARHLEHRLRTVQERPQRQVSSVVSLG